MPQFKEKPGVGSYPADKDAPVVKNEGVKTIDIFGGDKLPAPFGAGPREGDKMNRRQKAEKDAKKFFGGKPYKKGLSLDHSDKRKQG